ncbi:MAG TPA: rod shape-determining protein MreD [Chloroflexota bacterium]
MNVRNLHPGFVTALWLIPILALLQASIAGHLAIRGVLPGLVLIAVVDWGILRGTDEGMLWAFLAGLCLDVFSGWPPGTNTVALVTVASVVSLGQGTFIRTHALLPPATVFGATILFYVIALFILESIHQPVEWITALRDTVLPIAIYNALLNVVGFRLVQRLESRVYPLPRANW